MHSVFNTEVRGERGITPQYLFAFFWLRWPAQLPFLAQAILTLTGAEIVRLLAF